MLIGSEDIVLDLDVIAGRERAAAWSKWTTSAFPGLIVKQTEGKRATGIVRLSPVGAGRFWLVVSTCQALESNAADLAPNEILAALIMQKTGVTVATQEGRTARLNAGEMTIVDGKLPFTIQSFGLSQTAVCVFPRIMAAEHFPRLLSHSAQVIDSGQPLVKFITHLIEDVFRPGKALSDSEQAGVLRAFHALIGGLQMPEQANSPSIHWRVNDALRVIDDAIDDTELDAAMIAARQNISRRRLDQLFISEIGSTVAGQILDRRLTHAAAALCDPQYSSRHITEIAFDAGFKDSAHFSRSFKKRFGFSPREWRKRHIVPGDAKSE